MRGAVEIEIIPATPAHIRTIARRMRQADRDEVFAVSRLTPGQALCKSLRKSSQAWTAMINGRPEIMFGVGDLNILAGVGAPWLLGTEAVEEHYVAFLRGSVEWRNQLLRRYETLRNFVDARNRASIRWLRWLGFKLFDPVNLRGHEFHLFELRSADVRFDDGSNDRLDYRRSGRLISASAGHASRG